MSAFVCTHEHVASLVGSALALGFTYPSIRGGDLLASPLEMMDLLMEANVYAVNYRYAGHSDVEVAEVFTPAHLDTAKLFYLAIKDGAVCTRSVHGSFRRFVYQVSQGSYEDHRAWPLIAHMLKCLSKATDGEYDFNYLSHEMAVIETGPFI